MHYSVWQRFFAWANLACQVGIIVTGGLVRLTGSGLGCSTWPLCEPGHFTPVFHEATTWHPYIEFGNRTLTGVLTIVSVALILTLYRTAKPDRRDLLPLAWGVLAMIALQAVVGGISVWLHLHPSVVGLHMALSLGLVSMSALIVTRLYRPSTGTAEVAPTTKAFHVALGAAMTACAILGVVVTGTGPHSGDASRPMRFELNPLTITRIHALSAWLVLILVAVCWYLAKQHGERTNAWTITFAVVIAQGVLGYVQYLLGLNRAIILLHMLGSGLLVVAITWAIAAAYRPVHSPAAPSLSPQR